MNALQIALLISAVITGMIGIAALFRAAKRTAEDVHVDLLEASMEVDSKAAERIEQLVRADEEIESLSDEMGKHGFLTTKERDAFKRNVKLITLAGFIIPITVAPFILSKTGSALFLTLIIGSVSYLFARAGMRRHRRKWLQSIEFNLPIVMERLVMAVQAGNDILSGLSKVLKLEDERLKKSKIRSLQTPDPVTVLLRFVLKITERGCSFEDATSYVANQIDSHPLRHAFVHLALSHKEGGELVKPLKELSDATQLYYQESIDEEIAKMPVKATMPLILTFGGLILFFLTTPLIQVLEVTKRSTITTDQVSQPNRK